MLAKGALRGLLAVSVCLALATGVADADESPDELSKKGVELAKSGDYAGAIELFKKAFAGEAKSTYLCNIGMSFYAQDDFARAHLYLQRCFEKAGAPVAGMAEPFKYAVTQLDQGEFAKVTINTNPTAAVISISSLPGELRFAAPQVVYLPVGKHTVDVELEGYEKGTQEVAVVAREAQSVLISMVETPKPPPPVIEPKEPIELGPTAPETIATVETFETESRWRRRPAWIATAFTGAALGTAIGLRIAAGRIHENEIVSCDDGCPLPPGEEYDKARDRVERYYYSSLVMFGVSGILATTTAVLFALPEKKTRAPRAVVVPRPGGAMVQISVTR